MVSTLRYFQKLELEFSFTVSSIFQPAGLIIPCDLLLHINLSGSDTHNGAQQDWMVITNKSDHQNKDSAVILVSAMLQVPWKND